MKIAACLSSKSEEWSTPQDIFDELNSEFNFDLDPCATNENHKCLAYFTKEDDGLSKDWGGVPRVYESTIRQADRKVGSKGLGRIKEAWDNGCVFAPGQDGCKVVSRILLAWRDQIHKRAATIRWKQMERAVSVNDSRV